MTKEDEAYLAAIENWLVQQRMLVEENHLLNSHARELIDLYNKFIALRNQQSVFIEQQIILA